MPVFFYTAGDGVLMLNDPGVLEAIKKMKTEKKDAPAAKKRE